MITGVVYPICRQMFVFCDYEIICPDLLPQPSIKCVLFTDIILCGGYIAIDHAVDFVGH